MYNLTLDFKYKTLAIFVLLFIIPSCIAKNPIPIALKADFYLIFSEEDALSEKWAEYAYRHLSKRFKDKSTVDLFVGKAPKKLKENHRGIYFEVAEDLKSDYCLEFQGEILRIRVKNEKIAVWIIYQLIASIGEVDNRCNYEDLPPSSILWEQGCFDFDFEYREPYFSLNLEPDFSALLGNNNLEIDWGLWGHNLLKILPKQDFLIEDLNYNKDVYAIVNGKKNENQLNFSSDKLFRIVSEFIIDNYGDGKKDPYRFMIAPQDNDLVCTCPGCSELGNTANNGTPALTDFIRKLCERFPKHQFYTIAYKSTFEAPEFNLHKNAGVFLSTIDLPKGVALSENQKQTRLFLNVLENWKKKTPNIYIWDYAANFDDYLTPIPLFYGMQKQFRFFKEIGVKGIFINGSGYDFSAFDDLKTIVSSALMKNVNTNIDSLCFQYFKHNFPKNHQFFYDYYIELEKDFDKKEISYDMYGGFKANLQTYLDEEKFLSFYNSLKTRIEDTGGKEKEKMLKLFTGFAYTRLQIAYENGKSTNGFLKKEEDKLIVLSEIKNDIQNLENYSNYPDLMRYKEDGGNLNVYISQWKSLVESGSFQNLLLNEQLGLVTSPDEGYEKTDMLNDGIPGFVDNYHQGWYISSSDLKIQFNSTTFTGNKTVELVFLNDSQHRFYTPEKIEMWMNNELVNSIYPEEMTNFEGKTVCRFITAFPEDGNALLKIFSDTANNGKIAVDEIRILN